jgi:hypothetical protein
MVQPLHLRFIEAFRFFHQVFTKDLALGVENELIAVGPIWTFFDDKNFA